MNKILVLGIIETITGISGFGILWWQTNFWIGLSVFLLIWSAYCHFGIEELKKS